MTWRQRRRLSAAAACYAPFSILSRYRWLAHLSTERRKHNAWLNRRGHNEVRDDDMPFVSLLTGQPSQITLYSVGLPLIVGAVHCYQVVLPYYHRTGRLSLRPKE